TDKEGTENYAGQRVTPGTFEFFGVPPLLGRVMQPPDYEPGAPPVFVMRYKTWVNRFSSDPGILNQVFVLNGTPRTLIGIMPPRFAWGGADMWIPEKPAASSTPAASGFPAYWFLLGHLKPGVRENQAQADFTVLANRLSQTYPKEYPQHFTVEIGSLTNLV